MRAAMRRVPSTVTVVTAAGADEARGITIGSFTSVSLDPPLICFNVQKEAQMHPLITTTPRFAVHILNDEQVHLSDHFAVPDRTGAEQFAGVPYRREADGLPILDDALAVFHCRLYAIYEAGDHSIILGEVVDVEVAGEGGPVLYYERTYRGLGETLQPRQPASVNGVSGESP